MINFLITDNDIDNYEDEIDYDSILDKIEKLEKTVNKHEKILIKLKKIIKKMEGDL